MDNSFLEYPVIMFAVVRIESSHFGVAVLKICITPLCDKEKFRMQSGKNITVRLLVPLLCLLAMLLAACGSQGGSTPPGGNSTSKAPDDKQVLHYPVVGDI